MPPYQLPPYVRFNSPFDQFVLPGHRDGGIYGSGPPQYGPPQPTAPVARALPPVAVSPVETPPPVPEMAGPPMPTLRSLPGGSPPITQPPPDRLQELQALLTNVSPQARQALEQGPPVRQQPGMLRRILSGAAGAAGGLVNAGGRVQIPGQTIQSAQQNIMYPGYAQKLAQYGSARKEAEGALATAQADQMTRAKIAAEQARQSSAQATEQLRRTQERRGRYQTTQYGVIDTETGQPAYTPPQKPHVFSPGQGYEDPAAPGGVRIPIPTGPGPQAKDSIYQQIESVAPDAGTAERYKRIADAHLAVNDFKAASDVVQKIVDVQNRQPGAFQMLVQEFVRSSGRQPNADEIVKLNRAVESLPKGYFLADLDPSGTIRGAWNPAQGTYVPAPAPGMRRAEVGPEKTKMGENATSGLRALTTMRQMHNEDPKILLAAAVPITPKARIFETARKELSDVITRLRTGAALNMQEESFYKSQMPTVGDYIFGDPSVVEYKLKLFEDLFEGMAQKAAANPQAQPPSPGAPQPAQRNLPGSTGAQQGGASTNSPQSDPLGIR